MGEPSGETDPTEMTDDEPWIWERAKSYADSYRDMRPKFINRFIHEPSSGHAYGPQTLQQLRLLLGLDETKFSDEFLHEHTDALLVLIGRNLVLTTNETTKARLQRLRGKLLSPTQKFLIALQHEDLTREFLHDELPLDEVKREELVEQV